MSVQTISEALFEQHCRSRMVAFRRIAETQFKVADYELGLGCGTVVVEVKQLDPNADDIAAETQTEGLVFGSMVGVANRLRNLLNAAYLQIKPYASNGTPCVVVCYNNAGMFNLLDNLTVTRAMFGEIAVFLGLGTDDDFHFLGQGFTGRRKVTRESFRGLSALCVLSTPTEHELRLVAYHNPYASHPIAPVDLAALADAQFGYDDPHDGRNVALLAHELSV